MTCTWIKRQMTPEQVQFAINLLTRAFGKPPTRFRHEDNEKSIAWIKGREWRTLAVIDRQDASEHYVSLCAWQDYPLDEQRLAYQLANELRRAGIACEVARYSVIQEDDATDERS